MSSIGLTRDGYAKPRSAIKGSLARAAGNQKRWAFSPSAQIRRKKRSKTQLSWLLTPQGNRSSRFEINSERDHLKLLDDDVMEEDGRSIR